MSGPVGSSQWMYASGDFTIDQSLRFNDLEAGGYSYLTRINPAAGNLKIWTYSCWFKLGHINPANGYDQVLLGSATRPVISITTNPDPYGNINCQDSSGQIKTTAFYRDHSAWYHLVYVHDSNNGTAGNRMRLYINGSEITEFSVDSNPTQNADSAVNKAEAQFIGRVDGSARYFDGYLAEVHFIDGVVKTPSDFGESGDYGEWKPKEYSGAYGTNGFYLPFKQDYTVEGMSTVTYKGTNATQYIGGVGFEPDLIWFKSRSQSRYHAWWDNIRGMSAIHSNNTDAQATNATETSDLVEFRSDGFLIGPVEGYNSVNENTQSLVAWCWDFEGSSRSAHTITASGNAQHSTTQKKIGTTSLKFDGTDDFLSVADSAVFDLTTNSDLTIEFWFYCGSQGDTYPSIMGSATSSWSTNSNVVRIGPNGTNNKLEFYHYSGDGATPMLTSTTTVTNSAWHHGAIVREKATWTLYLDGTSEDTYTGTNPDTDLSDNGSLFIGKNGWDGTSGDFVGYLDEIRISAVARYKSNFTAPTKEFLDDKATILLIHSNTSNASTTFTDSSTGLTPVENTSGSNVSRVRANPTFGQSMVRYTGTGGPDTVGHGLSGAPEMIIVKNCDNAGNEWVVYHANNTAAPETDYLRLDTTAATADYGFWNDTAPTSSVFTVGDLRPVNGAWGDRYIAYCFDSVAGYSSFGTYDGDGTYDGSNTVNCGFEPAWVMIKCTNDTESWWIFDNTRNSPGTTAKNRIAADSTGAETTGGSTGSDWIQLTSTGFKMTGQGGGTNGGSGQKYVYAAFADKREYAYWLDQSGNNNDWTSVNLTESDIVLDTPSNNFCTLDPNSQTIYGDGEARNKALLSDGNLTFDTQSTSYTTYLAAAGSMELGNSGKWYAECRCNVHDSTGSIAIGITFDWQYDWYRSSQPGEFAMTWGYNSSGWITNNNSNQLTGSSYTVGDIVGMAVDLDNDKIYFHKNGVWNTNNPSGGSGLSLSSYAGSNAVITCGATNSQRKSGTWNFGQDSSFAGAATPQGYQDGNEIGDFYYEPPSGYLAICTSNLTDPIKPQSHHKTVTYTGNNATSLAITGVGFQPDFIWLKRRDSGASHYLVDAVRGRSQGVLTNATTAEYTTSDTTRDLRSFDSDGFTVGQDYYWSVNTSGATMVAWNWKANGSGSSNTNGSINTTATSANQDAGFSISTYTGTGSNATVGHGLSKAPEMIIIKQRNDAQHSVVFYHALANANLNNTSDATDVLVLSGNSTTSDSALYWQDTVPTTSVFSIGTHAQVNGSSDTYIAYCFHDVDGFSRVGGYRGNGAADGPFVHTGFRPSFVMLKQTSNAGDWYIYDCKREGYNKDNDYLRANYNSAESADDVMDIYANGFKIQSTNSEHNGSGQLFLYLAFAEFPFKYTNAR